MNEPIRGIYSLGLEDIVCIDLNCCSMADIAKPGFEEKLAEIETSISQGIHQLYAYIMIKPDLDREAVMSHNRTVLKIKEEILSKKMLMGWTKTCLHCNRLFSTNDAGHTECVFCWEDAH